MSKIRKLTEENKADIWSKCDSEGLSYYIQNYSAEDFHNTVHAALFKEIAEKLDEAQEILDGFEVTDGN